MLLLKVNVYSDPQFYSQVYIYSTEMYSTVHQSSSSKTPIASLKIFKPEHKCNIHKPIYLYILIFTHIYICFYIYLCIKYISKIYAYMLNWVGSYSRILYNNANELTTIHAAKDKGLTSTMLH